MAFLQRDHFEGCTDFASHLERAYQPTEFDLDGWAGFNRDADGNIVEKEAWKRAIEWTLRHAGDRTVSVRVKDPETESADGRSYTCYYFNGIVLDVAGLLAPKGVRAPVAILRGEGNVQCIPYELIVDIEVLTSSEEER